MTADEGVRAALGSRDWTGARADYSPPDAEAKVVLSGRVDVRLAARVAADAEAAGVRPSAMLNQLLGEAYAARDVAEGALLVVRPGDVVRALAQVAQRPAQDAA